MKEMILLYQLQLAAGIEHNWLGRLVGCFPYIGEDWWDTAAGMLTSSHWLIGQIALLVDHVSRPASGNYSTSCVAELDSTIGLFLPLFKGRIASENSFMKTIMLKSQGG